MGGEEVEEVGAKGNREMGSSWQRKWNRGLFVLFVRIKGSKFVCKWE